MLDHGSGENIVPNIFSGIGFEEFCSPYILRNWF